MTWDARPNAGQKATSSPSASPELVALEPCTTASQRRKRWLKTWDQVRHEEEWWFASTAIPLIAATIGPLANVFSIAAYVTSWRIRVVGPDQQPIPELMGQTFPDPPWCLDVNAASLACGFLGNLFLLANFTNRIRYIVALPMTIVLWYMSTGMLIGITVAMDMYVGPHRPDETYSQGFWYAVLAAILYLVCSMILMVNMLGYFLGHYPKQFSLTDAQRTLILQTMMFFIWLAGGAGVFSLVGTENDEPGWSFVNALYFCDVTILTVGFGDVVSSNDVGRGLVFPYSVGGIIMLGLVISSISRFVGEIGHDKIIKKRAEAKRNRTLERSMANESSQVQQQQQQQQLKNNTSLGQTLKDSADDTASSADSKPVLEAIRRTGNKILLGPIRRAARPRAVVLREEKDRFEAMRSIQDSMKSFKQWTALASSVVVFAMLWCIGAAVFHVTERASQGMTYFQALYFCYVSLLTIGYGDLAPKSNAGRPFFVVWSLLAVPTMTILVSTLGDTVINRFKHGTSKLADFTILPKYGIWADLLGRVQVRRQRRAAERRVEAGFAVGPDDPDDLDPALQHRAPTLEQLAAAQPDRSERDLARDLAAAIRRTAHDLKKGHDRRYSYEEWVELTELMRFGVQADPGAGDSLVDWDWIGHDSPMMADASEPEFVLERLCESMSRYIGGRGRPEAGSGRAAEEDKTKSKTRRRKSDGSIVVKTSRGYSDGDEDDGLEVAEKS